MPISNAEAQKRMRARTKARLARLEAGHRETLAAVDLFVDLGMADTFAHHFRRIARTALGETK